MPKPIDQENKSIPGYFKSGNQLNKEHFLKQCQESLEKRVLNNHPEHSQSSQVQEVLEQAWQNYLELCNFFITNHVLEGSPSSPPIKEQSEFIYFTEFKRFAPRLGPDLWDFIEVISSSPEKWKEYSEQQRSSILKMLNFPKYDFTKDVLCNYQHSLTEAVGNTLYQQALTMIAIGVDVNSYSPTTGNNPLLLSISKGWEHQNTGNQSKPSDLDPHKKIIKNLIQHNANVNAIHLANGMTPLHIACLRGDNPELILLLLKHGAHVDVKDYTNATPLDLLKTSYEETQKIVNKLTTLDEYGDPHWAFGLDGDETRSITATLPSREKRQQNQQEIKKILEEALQIQADQKLSLKKGSIDNTPTAVQERTNKLQSFDSKLVLVEEIANQLSEKSDLILQHSAKICFNLIQSAKDSRKNYLNGQWDSKLFEKKIHQDVDNQIAELKKLQKSNIFFSDSQIKAPLYKKLISLLINFFRNLFGLELSSKKVLKTINDVKLILKDFECPSDTPETGMKNK